MRRFWLGLLATALLMPSALAQTAAVRLGEMEEGGCAVLLDVDTGEVRTAQQDWMDISRIVGTPDEAPLFAAVPAGLTGAGGDENAMPHALMDAQGHCLTEAEFSWLEYFPESDVLVGQRADGMQRALSVRGETLLDGYAFITPNGEGGWLVMEDAQLDDDGGVRGRLTLLAADGTRTDTGVYAQRWNILPYACGRCRVSVDDETIYLDANGRVVFRLKGGYGLDFEWDTVVYRNADNQVSLLNLSGEEVLPAVYTDLSRTDRFGDQAVLLGTRADGTIEMLDAAGTELRMTLSINDGAEDDYYYAYQDGWATIHIGNNARSEIYTLSGECLLSLAYTGDSVSYSTDYAVIGEGEIPQRYVRQEGQWPIFESQLMTLDGTPVGEAHRGIELTYWMNGQARCITTDCDLVQADGQWQVDFERLRKGVIDENGATVLEPVYDSVEILRMDRYWVRMGDEYALLDGEGNALARLSGYSQLMD